MPAPDLILQKPYVLVSRAGSGLGLVSLSTTHVFGTVAVVYETSDKTTVGQVVLFNPSAGTPFQYGSTYYYVMDEKDLLFREVPLP